MMHSLRLVNFVHQLRRAGPINPVAIAFILTEMRFRGSFFRACETVFAFYLLYFLRREPTLTVGKCQVSFAYWRNRFGRNNFALFRATWNDVANYHVCCDYLLANEKRNLRETITRYNGRPSTLYVKLFHEHLEMIDAILRRLGKPVGRVSVGNASPIAVIQ